MESGGTDVHDTQHTRRAVPILLTLPKGQTSLTFTSHAAFLNISVSARTIEDYLPLLVLCIGRLLAIGGAIVTEKPAG